MSNDVAATNDVAVNDGVATGTTSDALASQVAEDANDIVTVKTLAETVASNNEAATSVTIKRYKTYITAPISEAALDWRRQLLPDDVITFWIKLSSGAMAQCYGQIVGRTTYKSSINDSEKSIEEIQYNVAMLNAKDMVAEGLTIHDDWVKLSKFLMLVTKANGELAQVKSRTRTVTVPVMPLQVLDRDSTYRKLRENMRKEENGTGRSRRQTTSRSGGIDHSTNLRRIVTS